MLYVQSSQLSTADAVCLGTNVLLPLRRERRGASPAVRASRAKLTPHRMTLAAVNRSLAAHGESIDRFNAARRARVDADCR